MNNSITPKNESTIVFSILIIMAGLVLVAKINSYRAGAILEKNLSYPKEVYVSITGCVSKPGRYKVFEGVLLEEVVKKARPKLFADLRALPLKKHMTEGCSFEVKKLESIEVYVSGAVLHPCIVQMDAGSRISDLKSKLKLTNRADLNFFKKRKILRDGERIEIPNKPLEQNSQN